MVAMETTFETAMTKAKKLVYKNRIRVKDFVADFDKLRSGFIYPNHFLTALSMAGLDKVLTPAELQTICDAYTVPRSPSLIMTDYKTFLNDVDVVFTLPVGLEALHASNSGLHPRCLLSFSAAWQLKGGLSVLKQQFSMCGACLLAEPGEDTIGRGRSRAS
jgi:hypothetical protein